MLNACFIFIFSTILFGYFLMIIIRQYSITGMVQLSISWLLGSMSTGFLIWILTLFFSFSQKLIFAIIAFHVIFCFIVVICFRDKPEQLNVNFEKHSRLFIILIVVSIYSLGYLNSVYYNFPKSFPSSACEIFDVEMSFISSFRYGTNQFPRFYDALNFIRYHKLLSNSSNETFVKEFSEIHEIRLNNFLFDSKNFYFKNTQNPFYFVFRSFFFNDPMRNGKTFTWPTLPLIYLASLNELGMTYSEASIIVCLLNTIATVVGIFFLSHFFLSKTDLSIVLIFLFSSGWALFHFLYQNDNENSKSRFSEFDDYDLIHSFGKERKCPFFSPILNLLSFSKHSSFAIPLSLFTLAFAHPLTVIKPTTYILAGILLLLNPSPATSLSLIISLSFYSNSIKYILPFVVSVIPKLIVFNDNFNINEHFLSVIENNDKSFDFYNNQKCSCRLAQAISLLIKVKPLWREYQMQGIFYSQILIWFDSFGFLFFFLILSPFLLYMINSSILTQRFIASFASFVILSVFRVGNDYFENSTAIISVFLPYLVLLYSKSLDKISNSDENNINIDSLNSKRRFAFFNNLSNFFLNGKNGKSKQYQGVFKAINLIFVSIAVFGTFCSAFVVSGFRINQLLPANFYYKYLNPNLSISIEKPKRTFEIPENNFYFIENLKKSSIHPRTPIFCDPRIFNPISAFGGRPVFSGNLHELWRRGADISEELAIIELINQTNDRYLIMTKLGYEYLFEDIEKPFIIVNSSIINMFDVLYTDEKYIFSKIRENV